jgi:hypothetical protein
MFVPHRDGEYEDSQRLSTLTVGHVWKQEVFVDLLGKQKKRSQANAALIIYVCFKPLTASLRRKALFKDVFIPRPSSLHPSMISQPSNWRPSRPTSRSEVKNKWHNLMETKTALVTRKFRLKPRIKGHENVKPCIVVYHILSVLSIPSL